MNAAALQDRRDLVRESLTDPRLTPVNGIDFMQVDPADPARLVVQFVFDIDTDTEPPSPTAVGSALTKSQFWITGGDRITSITVRSVQRISARQIAVQVDRVGDFSTYRLHIGTPAAVPPAGEPPEPPTAPPGFDPLLCATDFTFHIECAKRFDCKASTVCVPTQAPAPNIDYLARDYPSFTQVMLDRLALLSPRWRERNPADLGVAIVELLAYAADQLSYRHDVIDTEAYIGTARLRTSVRRHARLVDYRINDGSNARVWLALELTGDLEDGVPPGTRCCTLFDGAQPPALSRDSVTYNQAITAGAEFFEVLADCFQDGGATPSSRKLWAKNSVMPLYNWSAKESCLAPGCTSATLEGTYELERGDFLIFAEAMGPRTGQPEDADPTKRCVVRLVRDGETAMDPLTRRAVTRIAWHAEDALRFPLCVSSITDAAHGNQPIVGVSVVYGNVILADHGRTLGEPLESGPEKLGRVPARGRFRPALAQHPVTIPAANPYRKDNPSDTTRPIASAARATLWTAADTAPTVTLTSVDLNGVWLDWTAVGDLLEGTITAIDRLFEHEVENDGTSYVRFGDDVNGQAVRPDMLFTARYRVGNGAVGNVAAETLALIDQTFPGGGYISRISNPLPAFGGSDAETIEHVRQNAPVAFRTQERAVVPDDYVSRALQFPGVLRAAAAFRWTGSWMTVFLTVERTANALVDSAFKSALEAYMERYRMAGYDLEVEDAVRVPLHIAMHICVAPDYVATDVEQVLLDIFTSGLRPDGTPGAFNAQAFLLGEPFYLSPLYAAAQAVEGVASVRVTRFEREQAPDDAGLRTGVLLPDPLELFELANDPNYPERGQFELTVDGGL